MNLMRALIPLVMLWGLSCTDLGVGRPAKANTGVMFFNSVEGGAWGIHCDDGTLYRIIKGLPDGFQTEGLRVEFLGVINHQPSIYMWGVGLELVWIKKAR